MHRLVAFLVPAMVVAIPTVAMGGSIINRSVESPAPVVSIDDQQIERLPTLDCADVLRTQPGIIPTVGGEQDADDGRGPRIRIRGLSRTDARQGELCLDPDAAGILLGDLSARQNRTAIGGAINIITRSEGQRGVGATENPPGILRNPAFTFDFASQGYGGEAYFGFVSDPLAPYSNTGGFSLNGAEFLGGVEFHSLDGDARLSNLSFANGFGTPSVGVIPGIFINAPTDVRTLDFEMERNEVSFFGQINVPLESFGWGSGAASRQSSSTLYLLSVTDPNIPPPQSRERAPITPGGVLIRDRMWFFVSEAHAGGFNQSERLALDTFSPAFGPAGAANIIYNTEFDGIQFGGTIGLKHEAVTPLAGAGMPNLFLRTTVGATIGFDHYQVDVHDRLTISGLTSYDSSNAFSFSDTIPTAGLHAAATIGNERFDIGASIGVEYGAHPHIDYHRPDSDSMGNALTPVAGLEPDVTVNVGLKATYRFPVDR